MDRNQREITERIESMSIEEARNSIVSGAFGSHDSPDQNFALSLLSVKEARARDLREEESLSNSRKALEISKLANAFSERATLSSERATRIAISAIILSISMIIFEVIGLSP